MANRRPDLIMIAALELHGVFPGPVGEAIIACYADPPPTSYEAAKEMVREKIFETIASGALEGLDGAPEPVQLPVPRSSEDDEEHTCDGHCDDSPPYWWLRAFDCWYQLDL